jgi:hypothetical protein
MLSYDTKFASVAASDRADSLRKSYAAGRVPYRSDDGARDRDQAVRPVLAPAFGTTRVGCDADLSQRAA